VINKPEKPLDFLIDKLHNPLLNRVILMGAPGTHRKEMAQSLASKFGMTHIDVGALLEMESKKETPNAQMIQYSKMCNEMIPDKVITDVVKKKVEECEKESKHYVIEGFPRTKIQAMALEELGVIPNKILNL
jgi:adenylate kinase